MSEKKERDVKFYEGRRKHRREIREFLPPELQLEFPQKRSDTERWSFGGRLLKLKRLQEPADRLFIEKLKLDIKREINKRITEKDLREIEQLEKMVETEREEKILNLNVLVLYQAGLKDSDWAIRQGTVQSLGELAKMIDPKVFEKIDKALERLQAPTDYTFYFSSLISKLLGRKTDLGRVSLDYWSAFCALKKYSQEINQELREEKKTDDLEKFWQKHQLEIAKLHFLNLNLSNNWLMVYLKNFGFPRLERFFENVVRNVDEKILRKILPKIKDIGPEHFSCLLEIDSAYRRAGLGERIECLIEKYLAKERTTSKEIINDLGLNLLVEFAKKIGIKTEVKPEAFDQWNLNYLPRLFTAEAGYEEDDKELLKLIIKISFQEKSFTNSLFGKLEGKYSEEEKERLEELNKYNSQVREEFEKQGLDFAKWLNFQEKREFVVGALPDQLEKRRDSFEKNIIENIVDLIGSFREKKSGLLDRNQARELYNRIVKKYGLSFREGRIVHFEKKERFSVRDMGIILRDFNQQVEGYLQKERNREKKRAIATVLDHLKDLEKQVPAIEKQLNRKGYRCSVQTWQRNPGYDVFQGNYTHCCVAVENFNKGAILDYLTDANLQVVEVKDETEDRTIAQTWLWIGKDGQGNLNLVLDNVEINGDYFGLKNEIKKNLFGYIKDYVQNFGQGKIKRILLGTAYNDIDTEDLDSISLSLSKLAGSPRETEYLDALGSNWVDPSRETTRNFLEVAEIREREIREKERGQEKTKIEIVRRVDREILRELEKIEKRCFPRNLQESAEEIGEYFKTDGIQILIREGGKIIGYLNSLPAKEVDFAKKEHQTSDTLWVWSVDILPEKRNLRLAKMLYDKLLQEAKNKGFRKMVGMIRANQHLSDILQRRFNWRFIERHQDWYGTGEPFDYLEKSLEEQ